jgi:hypothetical protein
MGPVERSGVKLAFHVAAPELDLAALGGDCLRTLTRSFGLRASILRMKLRLRLELRRSGESGCSSCRLP